MLLLYPMTSITNIPSNWQSVQLLFIYYTLTDKSHSFFRGKAVGLNAVPEHSVLKFLRTESGCTDFYCYSFEREANKNHEISGPTPYLLECPGVYGKRYIRQMYPAFRSNFRQLWVRQ